MQNINAMAKKHTIGYNLLHDHSILSSVNNKVQNNFCDNINDYLDFPLNDSQQNVFLNSFNERLTLLWGPPGTGKTTVLSAITLGWIERAQIENSSCVIGVGSSNWTAIDNLLYDIKDLINSRLKVKGEFDIPVEVVRVQSTSGDDFIDDLIADIKVYSDEADELKEKLNNRSSCVILAGTWKQLYNLTKNAKGANAEVKKWIDLLLIDEASQVMVSHAAGYFLLLKETANVVLAGDDKQLGPIIGFQMENTNEGLFDCVYTFMKEKHSVAPIAIIENYRSNTLINTWPNERFYENKLISKFENKKLEINIEPQKPENWDEQLRWNDFFLEILDPSIPVVIITYPGSTYTVSNPFEAQLASALVRLYKKHLPENISNDDFVNKKIGIVTPHRAQKSNIYNLLSQAFGDGIESTIVDTVDRFQGQERDMIVCSYSVADKDFVMSEDEFILNPRRFNVSLTRAKSKFIMMISDSLLDYLPSDKKVAEDASHIQLFVRKRCKYLKNVDIEYIDISGDIKTMQCKIHILK